MNYRPTSPSTMPLTAKIGGAILAILIVASLTFWFGNTERVMAGESCLVLHHGKVDRVVGPGRYFDPAWGTSYACLSTRPTLAEYVAHDPSDSDSAANYVDWFVETTTSDGSPVKLTATFRYTVTTDNLEAVYLAARNNDQVFEKVVNTDARAAMREVATTTPIRDLYLDGRDAASDRMEQSLRDRLSRFGITLDSFELKDVIPTEEYRNAIQNQNNEAEEAQLEITRQETAREQAETKKIQAQGQADADLITANGKAEQNRVISESLTPEILYMQYVEALSTSTWMIFSPEDVQPTMPVETP